MKRKYLIIVLIFLLVLLLIGMHGCGGDVSSVVIKPYQSERYEQEEIQQAIDIILKVFKKSYPGCTLTELTYAGDEKTEREKDFAKKHNADEVIVLISNFHVDSSGQVVTFNPNSTYSNWLWILVRNNGSEWRLVDCGY